MKNRPACPACNAKTRVRFQGNYDCGTYIKTSKSRKEHRHFEKVKAPSDYRVVLQCTRKTCGAEHTFTGASKSRVHADLRKLQQAQRQALIEADRV